MEISTVFDERILAENSLSLAATISHKLPLTSYVWETVGEDEGTSSAYTIYWAWVQERRPGTTGKEHKF